MSDNQYMVSRNRRRYAQPRGFVAGLTPEGHINKIVADMNNLKGGYDIRNWSLSERKELTPALTVKLLIGKDPNTEVYVPKLALILASPVVRAHFVKNPAEVQAKFTHPDVSLEPVEQISKWLKGACHQSDFLELPVPQNLDAALKLRLTAHTLSMERYVEHMDAKYLAGIKERVPTLQEISEVVDNTRKNDDPIMVALANQLSFLCRYHKISESKEIEYTNFLAEDKYACLLNLIEKDTVL
ncbi:hypothetical protein BKA63DRAFT_579358 [Paraphoma chrysanthemicola]|nr:hypothetical protein BKA63DRAFT_579358 [Paraphoma chrysanthemicola]